MVLPIRPRVDRADPTAAAQDGQSSIRSTNVVPQAENVEIALQLHRAERADALVDALAAVVGDPLDDVMQAEVVSVPTRGVERWLSQRLSASLGASSDRRDGVCANLEFPFPGKVVGDAVAAASGIERDADPWQPDRSVWPLLDVVDASLGEPWMADLAAHLGAGNADPGPGRPARRFTSVRHIADLYDRYGVHRPQMVCSWAAGQDLDGAGRPLPERAQWQAELWRRLSRRLGTASPAERLDDACARLRADPALAELPRRLSIFGLTRLPASYLQVLRGLAAARDVHLFLLHPSPALWARIAGEITGRSGIMRRAADTTAELAVSPLLRSWGRDAREMQLVLTAGAAGTSAAAYEHLDHHSRIETVTDTLLQRLQAAVQADEAPPGEPLPGMDDTRPLLAESDRSVQVHACHGRARQVEVVRNVILHLLADDESLEARDIIVMCPDIETYAPLIHATFGAGYAGDSGATGEQVEPDVPADEHRPPDLRVRLADRSIRQTNPVLGVVAELLQLADSRLTAAQVLDLAGRDPVRRRFRFDDDGLARLKEWAVAGGVRWGLDGDHRGDFGLPGLSANTWRTGLDRLLLGVTMADEDQRLFGGVVPLDDVESGSIDLAGRFAEFVDRLAAALDGLRHPQRLPEWISALGAAGDALTATSERDSWQTAQLRRLLDDLGGEATGGEATGAGDAATAETTLALPEIRSLMADRLRGRPTRANFRTGHLTICTLVPMRSVPHRVVVLLGLDDGVFPRKAARDGDDLTVDDPYVGDRDSRSEDRQLLLDALMATTDRLVVTYTGRDERTNAPSAPAVPLGELLDVIDRTVRTSGGEPARNRVVVRHPLQPFDARNFTVGTMLPDRPWSFDPVALDGARALTGPRVQRRPFLAGPLPAPAGDIVEVDRLVAFVQHPVKAFLRQRLGINVGNYFEKLADALPIDLDALEKWNVGQRLLDARLAGAPPAACAAAELARGVLPPGSFAGPILAELGPTVESLVSAAASVVAGGGEPRSIDVRIRLPDGRALVGTVPVVSDTMLRSVTYSRLGPKHRLAAWVRFLCLAAARPEAQFTAVTLGRRRSDVRRGDVTIATLAAFAADPATCREVALAHLAGLIDLYDRGMREPLPLYCAASAAYAAAVNSGAEPDAAARKAWESDKFPKEDADPEHVVVLGAGCPYDTLAEPAPAAGEDGIGWALDEPTRFGRYARRLWEPLLACEELVDR